MKIKNRNGSAAPIIIIVTLITCLIVAYLILTQRSTMSPKSEQSPVSAAQEAVEKINAKQQEVMDEIVSVTAQ